MHLNTYQQRQFNTAKKANFQLQIATDMENLAAFNNLLEDLNRGLHKKIKVKLLKTWITQ